MNFRRILTMCLLMALLLPQGGVAQRPRTFPRPKLVVIVVVDQMRADYIERYGHQWTQGLRRLLDRGAWFRLAAYPYWNTVTCVGHATISTGSLPATHGMVLNAWYDRAAGKSMGCTEDPAVESFNPAGQRSGGESPHRLLMPTLADELRAQAPHGARVVTLSLKARTAITLAGRRGDAVLWHGGASGWLTSTFYAKSFPAFVERTLQAHPPEQEYARTWVKLLPESAYLYSDDALGERPPQGEKTVFPHELRSPGGWQASPFSDAYLGELAVAAVEQLGLGKGPGTDFLGVSFSALDYVGHRYGPRSHEVQDVLARLDVTLGKLLEHLDRTVGAQNYVLAFSSDHGVAPIPEQVSAEGISAGRVSTQEIASRVEKALEPLLGPGPDVVHVEYTDLYFRHGVYEKVRADARALRAVKDAVLGIPGVWRVFESEELSRTLPSDDPVRRAVALSHHPQRSGDLIVLEQPYWSPSTAATTHGSGFGYDARVPVVLVGPGIRPGEYQQGASPADIAPTLAYFCGITLAHSEGRVLSEAIAPRAPAARPRSRP